MSTESEDRRAGRPITASVVKRLAQPRAATIHLLIAVVTLQALYWVAFSPLQSQRTSIAADGFITKVDVAVLSGEASLEAARALSEAAWSPIEPGWYAPSTEPTHAFRFALDLDEKPSGDLGLITGFGADNYHVWVNSYPVVDEGRIGPDSTYHADALRGVLRVSQAMIEPGSNEVVVIATRRKPGYTDVFPHAWGDYEALRASTERRAFMTGPYRSGVMILFGLVAAFALIATPFAANRAFFGWFGCLTGALALQIAQRRFPDPPWGPNTEIIFYFALGLIVATAWFNTLDSWTGRGSPLARRVASAICAVLLLTSAIAILRAQVAGYDLAGALLDGWTLIAGAAAGALLVARLVRRGGQRPWEVAALLVGVVALVTDAGFQLLASRNMGHFTSALPFIVFALVAAILVRNIRIYESLSALNDALNAELAARQSEIEAHHARLRALQRERDIAEERQRIMRDMHDGLGSQLMSMLLAARRGDVTPQRIAEGLQFVIDEIRLMIHAMDSAGETLGSALLTFRKRTEERVAAAGLAFRWSNTADGALAGYGPREALQVIRVLQEAVTNALRHSGGSSVEIEIASEGDGIVIRVSDNGAGLAPDFERGRGLDNMTARAAALGATLTVEDRKPGVCVILRLPPRPPGKT